MSKHEDRKKAKSEEKNKESHPHVEREKAGYILGTPRQRKASIKKIWDEIKGNTRHFRAPGHHPVSSSELIENSRLSKKRSELHIDHKPGRHILYLDTLDLALRRSSVQARLEIKQKQKHGKLDDKFAELTVKIGTKATQRFEESVRINLNTLKTKGFDLALSEGIEAKCDKEKSPVARAQTRAKLEEFHEILKKALKKGVNQKLNKIKTYSLVHLNRDTAETEFSPCDHKETILEVKTDDCGWETLFGHIGKFAQIEIEHIKGDEKFFKRELESLTSRRDFNISATDDSKEEPAMKLLEKILLPQNELPEEARRIENNRKILAECLDPVSFRPIKRPRSLGINTCPVNPVNKSSLEAPALNAA